MALGVGQLFLFEAAIDYEATVEGGTG